jgi:two-component system, cell cycle sensor histidine kinase and response regulator CckA
MSPQRTKQLGLFALGLALAVVALIASVSALTLKRLSSRHAVNTSHRIQILNRTIRFEMTSAERDQISYLLTGSGAYRQECEIKMQRIPATVDELLKLVAESPSQRQRAQTLKNLTAEKRAMLGEGIRLRGSKGPAAALELMRAGAARDVTGRINEISDEIESAEYAYLDRRFSALVQREQTIGAINVGGALTLAVLVACAALALTRALNRQQDLTRATESARDLLRTTLYSIGDAVIVTDANGCVRMMNPVAERLTGHSEKAAAGLPAGNVFQIVDAETHEPIPDQIEKVLREGNAVKVAANSILKRQDGGEVPINESGAPILDAMGTLQGAILVLSDATEAKRANDALLESEQKFRSTADSAPVGIWTETPEEKRDYFNSRWLQYTGRTFEEEAGTGWMEGIHPDDALRARQQMVQVKRERRPYSVEYRLRRADGRYGWVLGRGVPRFDASGRFLGYIGTCSEIDEIKEADEKLRDAAKFESLGVLAGGIAHDFNNILVGILGSACLLEEYVPEDSPGRELVANLQHASDRAARLTRQMLAYSGRGRFYLESLDLSEQVREVLTLLKASAPKNVDIRLSLADGLPSTAADATQVQQVIANLAVNSAEAMPPLGGWIEISTRTEQVTANETGFVAGLDSAPGEYVVLQVADNGSGMDGETKSKMFDPFFSTKFAGRGLGLAATLGIMRSHHGAIKVDSTPGEGTTFRLYFPTAQTR